MGFLKQDAPVVDYAEWSKGTRAERIVPMARHWAEDCQCHSNVQMYK